MCLPWQCVERSGSGDDAPVVAGGRSRCCTACDGEISPERSEPRSVRRRGRRRYIGFALNLNAQLTTLQSGKDSASPFPQRSTHNTQLVNCKFYQLPSIIYQLPSTSYAKKFITRLTIISFSDGLDSAIITVKATSVWSAMRLEPSLRSSNLFRLRK